MRYLPSCLAILVALATMSCSPRQHAPGTSFDGVDFGDKSSEQRHGLTSQNCETGRGGLNLPMREFLPPKEKHWEGGRVAFEMAVDPERPNYFTAKFWGDDVNPDRLLLFCEGKQIGYRHLGDVEILDFGSPAPACPGRFFYRTTPLPESLTKGKTKVRLEIVANGPIWGYGQTFDKYQKPMETRSRGLYSAYTHLEPCFVPSKNEVRGAAPSAPPTRNAPGPEILDRLKKRVSDEITKLLRQPEPPNQMQMQFLARAYFVSWTPAHGNPAIVAKILAGADALCRQLQTNPKLAESDPVTPNPGWFGFGPAGHAISLLAKELSPVLDEKLQVGGKETTRRQAWSDMLFAGRDRNERSRRLYTNQTMIKDLNIYLANRGLEAIDPPRAKPEALDYLKESVGMVPWLGSLTDHGPERPLGNSYFQLTQAGLTKELGYVGNYGEVIDWVAQIYDATRPDPASPGNPEIRDQLVRIAKARACFRYPLSDADGFRAMRLETIVGWRDDKFPGDVVYAQRPSWDGSSVEAAAATLDPSLVGFCRQMFDDNQFFESVVHQMEPSGFRVTAGLLSIPDDYENVRSQSAGTARLPMSPGQPDFVWTDQENGVIALKHGDEILYASLYWRARNAVNFLAKVHHITPHFDRIAVVREACEFDPSGQHYKRADWVDAGFANGRFKYPGAPGSAHAGEVLPIAKIPEGIAFKPGDENVYAGKGTFYTLRFGEYLIAMNTTKDRSFELKVPPDLVGRDAVDLTLAKKLTLPQAIPVPSFSTLVLHVP